MKTLAGLLFAAALAGARATPPVPDGKAHVLLAANHQFTIDGRPIEIVAGEMHFGRVLAEDWPARIRQAKAMGLNAVSLYLFWNQVEPEEGRFDFSGANDVRRVLKLCEANGLWAILRPGPYCCAETEFGGIPYWTLRHPGVRLRTSDPQYVAWSREYIDRVAEEVRDLQVTRGGPLILVQVENEYGSVARGDISYLKTLTGIFRAAGFEVPLFTCDPTTPVWSHPELRVPGLMYGRNGLKDEATYRKCLAAIGDYPVYVPEVYTGWFSGWGGPIDHRYSIAQDVQWLNFLLDHRFSFCLYVEFGGTNYGYSNGCNRYLPVQTSYDYDAPIDEAGRITPRYRAFRELLTRRLGVAPPPIPEDPPVIAVAPFGLTRHTALLDILPSRPTLVSKHPVSMEALGQAYGFVLYRKSFPAGIHGRLELRQARDYTVVLVNGAAVADAFRGYGLDSNQVELNHDGPATLDLLVYNLGRISVPLSDRSQDLGRKGLVGGAFLDGNELTGWSIYSLPLQSVGPFAPSDQEPTGPTIYRGTFSLAAVGGTFLDLRSWKMGVVWVNGHNAGRYWDRGALRSVFVPREWLKRGRNDIDVLELHGKPAKPEIAGVTHIIEEPAMPFAVRLDRN